MSKRRVVITGMGAVTGAGIGRQASWDAILSGRSGVGAITAFDASTFPSRIAAEIKNFHPEDFIEDRRTISRLGKGDEYGLVCARMAMDDSGLTAQNADFTRGGIFIGCGKEIGTPQALFSALGAALDETGQVDRARFGTEAMKQTHPLFLVKDLPNTVIFYISKTFQIPGVNSNMVLGNTASSQAVGEAFRAIQRGDCDFALAGGFDARIDPINISFLCDMGLLSSRNGSPAAACAPFDADRDGTVVGEGAAILVLEELGQALKHKGPIHAEMIGYSAAFDPAGILGRRAQGEGMASAISGALQDAGITSEPIDYINASGDGTIAADMSETAAIKKALGDSAYRIPISSIKPVTGHMMAASGAAELVFTTMAMEAGVIPPTINYRKPDPACDLDYVTGEGRRAAINTAISLSQCGIGGRCSALVIKKFNGGADEA